MSFESPYLEIESAKYPPCPRDFDELLEQVANLNHLIDLYPEYFPEIPSDAELIRIIDEGERRRKKLFE